MTATQLLIALFVGLLSVTTIMISKHRRFEALQQAPAPAHWRPTLEKNLPMIAKLQPSLWKQLVERMNIFLATKNFEGCGGLELTDEMKLTVAAQACLLLLGRDAKVYPKLKTVLLYPHTYTDGETARLGESWGIGVVILSWNSVVGGSRNFTDGHNVTFHEFAHQLDQASGSADGAPILGESNTYQAWSRVLNHDFEQLVSKTEHHRKDVMDPYGATNPAEFFAVVTETFFEKPHQLKEKHPELFEKLQNYYKVNPLNWI